MLSFLFYCYNEREMCRRLEKEKRFKYRTGPSMYDIDKLSRFLTPTPLPPLKCRRFKNGWFLALEKRTVSTFSFLCQASMAWLRDYQVSCFVLENNYTTHKSLDKIRWANICPFLFCQGFSIIKRNQLIQGVPVQYGFNQCCPRFSAVSNQH